MKKINIRIEENRINAVKGSIQNILNDNRIDNKDKEVFRYLLTKIENGKSITEVELVASFIRILGWESMEEIIGKISPEVSEYLINLIEKGF